MSLAQLISWGTLFYTFSLLMPALEVELGLTRVQVSGAFSAALLASGLTGFFAGQLIDRGHGRQVMCAGSLLAGLLLGAHAVIDTLTGLYLVWIGLGAAMACTLYEPAFNILIRRWPNDYRKSLIAMTFLGGLASTVFVPLSALLISALGWRSACVALGLMHLAICLPIHLVMLRGEPKPTWQKSPTETSPGWGDPELRRLAVSPAFILITGFVALFMVLGSGLTAHMVPLLRERGLPEAWVLAVPASIGALQVLGRLLLFILEGRIAPRLIDLMVPLLLCGSIVLLAAGGPRIETAILFAVFYGLGNGLVTIVKATAIAQYVNRERVAALGGLQAMPIALARAMGPIVLAAMWSASGSYDTGLWALAGVGVIATLMLRSAQARAVRAVSSH